MGAKITEPVGTRYHRWTIIEQLEPNERGMSRALCRCDCGKEVVQLLQNLRYGKSTQCHRCGLRQAWEKRPDALNVKLTRDDVVVIKRRLLAGERQTVIARDYPVNSEAIGNIARGVTWTHVPWEKPYEPPRRKPCGSLTPDMVRDIRERLSAGASVAELASEHNVSRQTIYFIRKGRTWRDVA